MGKAKHSPLPWRLGDLADSIVCDSLDGLPCKSTRYYGGTLVCESCQIADREFIIRAANCHDMLVEVLEQYALPYSDDELDQLAMTASGRGEISREDAQREVRRRAVIAKATS